MDKRIGRFIRVYPWFFGFSGDLLFYVAIDTLFLALVKDFSAAEIVSLTSFSQLACLALQFPILLVIKKIGNTASIRVGAFLLLLSSLLITFGGSYALVLLGRIFRDAALAFEAAMVVALENNLELTDRRKDFVRIRARAYMTYSIITLGISVVASYMFNLYRYLPMLCSVATCATGFVLSLFMRDCSDFNRISYKRDAKTSVKVHYSGFVILIFAVYALFYLLVANGQGEGKLFIQQHILLDSDEERAALIMGAIVFVSRLMRVFSNAVVKKLYGKYQAKLGVGLPILMGAAVGFMLFGSFVPSPIIKIPMMAMGYVIVLFSRDPFKLYMEDVVFASAPREQHQSLVAILEFGVKLATAGIGLVYSAILISCPMIVVISIMLAIAVVEIVLSLVLYRAILTGKEVRKSQRSECGV